MNTGLAIVTCVPENGAERVRLRLPAALKSLADSGYPGPVWIIDDGSADLEHLAFLESISTAFRVMCRPARGGIARAKNTALRALQEARVDLGFLAEDDITFLPGWWSAYLEAHQATGIHHFSWAWDDDPSGDMHKEEQVIQGYSVVATSRLNGVFLTFTPTVLEVIGGFKILPSLWGHEHTHWTRRIVNAGLAPFFADLIHSERYLGLNPHAAYSAIPSEDRPAYASENATLAEILLPLYEPITD